MILGKEMVLASKSQQKRSKMSFRQGLMGVDEEMSGVSAVFL